jgi:hypothetical protein
MAFWLAACRSGRSFVGPEVAGPMTGSAKPTPYGRVGTLRFATLRSLLRIIDAPGQCLRIQVVQMSLPGVGLGETFD